MVVNGARQSCVIPLSEVSYSLAGQTAHSGHSHALLSASVISSQVKVTLGHIYYIYFYINSNLILMSGVILPFYKTA